MDQLSLRIRLDDVQAFELLFRRYYAKLCLYANKYLNDPEEARDLVQEVFLRLWEGRRQIDPEDSLKSYIFRITMNLSISRLRRRKVETAYSGIYRLMYIDNREYSVLDTLLEKELEKNVAASVGRLPAECRKVFELSRTEGMKYREIAEALHISIKTVEAHMSRALRSLRTDLAEHLTIIALLLMFSKP